MFDRKENEGKGGGPLREAHVSLTELRESLDASGNPMPSPGEPLEEPRFLPETPAAREHRAGSTDDAKTLVVPRGIVFNGEINSCDRLVVEGQVEATLKDCSEIEVSETGIFRGQVEFDRADFSGVFEGDLTARLHLVVRATGRITGKVRFGELEIERGGQVMGDIEVFDEQAKKAGNTLRALKAGGE